ncbi:unannotated protein [freshwater metagenome]|uniref:Unannotated protein n=1 Tax=freshwater metagenome TaxID=449393 RepID=A0A6J7APR1_9ZZZZ
MIIVGHGKRAVDEFPSRGHYEVREGVCEGCEEGQGPVPGKVPGTFPITPATSDTWPALRPPGVFEFTLRLQLAPGQQRSGASNRV